MLRAVVVCLLLGPGLPVEAEAADTFEVITVEGRRIRGRLGTLTAEELKIGSTTLALPDVLRCDRLEPTPPLSPQAGRSVERVLPEGTAIVLLLGGDRLMVRVDGIDEEFLLVRWGLPLEGTAVKIPLERVRAVLWKVPRRTAERRRLIERLRRHRQGVDLVLLGGGDRLTGELSGLGGEGLVLKTDAVVRTVPLAAVTAVALNPQLQLPPRVPRRAVRVVLRDGSRLTAAWPTRRPDGRWSLRLMLGIRRRFDATAVQSIQFSGGRAEFLGSREPLEAVHTPFQGSPRPPVVDRSIAGGPLVVRGRWSAHGLGMASRTVATWKLDGTARWFCASAAIDDTAAGGGHVVFRVLVDGKTVLAATPVEGRDQPVPLGPIDLAGVKRLTLVVDYGRRADVGDHAAWIDARLVKQK